MSDVEKRQTQQRALSIAACAAAFAVGGPLIGYRFEVQKSEEAYRADAADLATQLVSSESDWREIEAPVAAQPVGEVRLQNASFSSFKPGKAKVGVVSRDTKPAAVTYRGRGDALALVNLASFSASHIDRAEHEQAELDCLAEAVYYEARSENVRGQMAVAEVVMNRVADTRFPKTVCEVVYQGQYRNTGCQFTFTCDGSRHSQPHGFAWDRARAVALHVQLGLNTPVTNKATHYHTDYVNPYWSAGMIVTAELGTHIFYRFPKGGAEWSRVRLALDAQQQHRNSITVLEDEALGDSEAIDFDLDIAADDEPATALVPVSADAPIEVAMLSKPL